MEMMISGSGTRDMVVANDNAPLLPFHERLLHLFISHFLRPIKSKHTTIQHSDYWFMYRVQQLSVINLPTLIFQDLIKLVKGNVKTIPYVMHLSCFILRMRCNVSVDPPVAWSKFTSFNRHTIAQMHYVRDEYDNYVKKMAQKRQEHPEFEEHEDEVQ